MCYETIALCFDSLQCGLLLGVTRLGNMESLVLTYEFCISTLILKLGMTMYMIRNIATNGMILKLIQWSKMFVKLGVHTIGYVPLLCALPTPQTICARGLAREYAHPVSNCKSQRFSYQGV